MFRTVAELKTAINACVDVTNADPKPFRWTKIADDILASFQRFCLLTLSANAKNEEDFRIMSLENSHETNLQVSEYEIRSLPITSLAPARSRQIIRSHMTCHSRFDFSRARP